MKKASHCCEAFLVVRRGGDPYKLWIKSKSCGEILNLDICISKTDTNARFIYRTHQIIIARNYS